MMLLQELAGELGAHLRQQAISVESVLRIVYMPQAVRTTAGPDLETG